MPDLSLSPSPSPSEEGLVERLTVRRYLGEHGDRDAARAAAAAQVERLRDRSRLLEVREDGVRRGEAWVVQQGDDLAVIDVALDDVALAPALRDALLDLARAERRSRLTVTVSPGDPGSEALVADGGFETFATQMRLDLDVEPPAEDVVVLRPMGQERYNEWIQGQVAEYAEARQRSGESAERAREVSEQQHAELLPDGLRSAGHHIFEGVAGEEVVGLLWLSTERPMVFVYDVVVEEAHRGRGHGAGIMRAGARWALDHGAHAIGLNVFGYNDVARRLYDRLGYQVTENFVARTP
ncbi:GNAT family N-acetyltransferase [Nocardioides marinquilinus]|uniref:GNAT family N-acetyltransferase n=1 Tax=Nocardioides marinquilinus TaxID=1210400 RepID=UPI0031E52757